MSKIWIITKREYLTRVRNKAFLLSTFLLPLVIVLFMVGAVLIAVNGKSHNRIAVIDANGYFKDYLMSDSTISFDFSPALDTLNYQQKGCTAVLIIPVLAEGEKRIYRLKYKKQLGFEGETDLEGKIRSAITDHMIYQRTTITRSKLDSIRGESDIAELRTFEDQGGKAKASSQGISYAIGYASGFLIYLLTFLYGAAVMRGVMEEKTNRIAEVIVSSVRPFELMMGKITGIGAVGLTQFMLWIILLAGLFYGPGLYPARYPKGSATIAAGECDGECVRRESRRSGADDLSYNERPELGQLGTDPVLFPVLFHRGLSFLFGLVCCGRQRRERGSSGGPGLVTADHHAGHLFVYYHVHRHSGSRWRPGHLGKHYPFQLLHRDDGQGALRRARHGAVVAIGAFHALSDPWIFIYRMAGRQDLSNWYPDVREKTHLENHVEMGF